MSFLATTYSSSNNGKIHPQSNNTVKSHKVRNTNKKRSSSIVNNSFALNLSSKIFKNSRSVSRDRTRKLSMGNMTPSNRKSASIQIYGLNSTSKLINGHPAPKDFDISPEIRLKTE